MAATNYTPIILYHSITASAAPTAGNLNNGELAINITDGKLFYKDNGGVVQVIATKGTGVIGGSDTQVQYNSSGALAGSANFTFNGTTASINTLNLTTALAAAYGGTGQSSYTTGDIIYATGATALSKLTIGANTTILTSNGSAPQWSAASAISVNTATNLAGGAAGSLPYQSGAGATTFLSIGSTNRVLTSSGSAPQWVTALSDLTGVSSNIATLGGSGFTLPAVLSATAPAKLYINTSTVTDGSSAIGATNTLGAITSFDATTVAATNANVTYTNLATLVINAVPVAGTNVTITNPYALYVAAGASYFGSTVTVNGTVNATTLDLTNLEVTNIKAKDGTTAIVLTDSTGAVAISTALTANGGAVFNENGANVDFRVEGDTNANLFFVDASADAVGIGTNAPNKLLTVNSATNDVEVLRINAPGGAGGVQAKADIGFGYYDTVAEANAAIGFEEHSVASTGGVLLFKTRPDGASESTRPIERARITSTGTLNIVGAGTAGSTQAISFNGSTPVDTLVTTSDGRVGVGTSSPTTKLHVSQSNAGNYASVILLSNSADVAADRTGIYGSAPPGNALPYRGGITFWPGAVGKMTFHTGNNAAPGDGQVMELSSSGNLGLGVAPSYRFHTASSAFQDNVVAIQQGTGQTTGNQNIIQFIDQVGTTGEINAYGSAYGVGYNLGLSIGSNYLNTTALGGSFNYSQNGYSSRYHQVSGQHQWFTAPSGTAGNAISFTQAMTLDASGNLIIGDTSTSSGLTLVRSGSTTAELKLNQTGTNGRDYRIGSTGSGYGSAGNLIFYDATASAERARITSGGNLLVGTQTDSGARCTIDAASATNALNIALPSYDYFGVVVHNKATSNDNSFIAFGTEASFTTRGTINYNRTGGLVAYNTTSDYRAKDIIGPVTDAGVTIDALKVYNGKMKGATVERPMLIAHEAQAVTPYAVTGEKDAVNDDGTPKYQQMDVSSLVPLLIAEIQSLRARVAQLESKGA